MKSGFGVLSKCIALGLILLVTGAAAGPKWEFGDDSWMKLSFLGQVHYASVDDAVQDQDFFLRRGRIILAGQITDGIKFFVETDNDNAGKAGMSASTDIQDAWIDVRLGESDHWVQGGIILLPFSFENRSSAASLLGIDYNAETIKFTNAFVWRDIGAEVHGNFGERVSYRAGVFDGYEAAEKNPEAYLRLTGHVAVNVIGAAETGWFFTNNRLGKDEYLTVGLGYDTQGDATAMTSGTDGLISSVEDSTAWVVDFQSSTNVSELPVLVNGAYYDWDSAKFKGNTAFLETGILLGNCMPTLKYSLQEADGADSIADFTLGINCFMKGHNARVGLEYRTGDSSDMILLGLQFLL